MVKQFQAIYFLMDAAKEKYESERANLIVEIYDLELRFAKFKAVHPEGTENAFQDKIDVTKDQLTELEEKFKLAIGFLENKIEPIANKPIIHDKATGQFDLGSD